MNEWEGWEWKNSLIFQVGLGAVAEDQESKGGMMTACTKRQKLRTPSK